MQKCQQKIYNIILFVISTKEIVSQITVNLQKCKFISKSQSYTYYILRPFCSFNSCHGPNDKSQEIRFIRGLYSIYLRTQSKIYKNITLRKIRNQSVIPSNVKVPTKQTDRWTDIPTITQNILKLISRCNTWGIKLPLPRVNVFRSQ